MQPKARLMTRSVILWAMIPLLLLITVIMGGVTYLRLRHVILDGFDRKLSAVSSVTGAFIDGTEHGAILREKTEESPRYRRWVDPMRRIRERLQLTFLYTQLLGEGSEIVYVLDGQVGEGHSAVGDRDSLPDAEVGGAREVLSRGKVHLSEIRAWDQWGLLKSGFAPIFGRDGAIVAMAGADVDISTIRHKTGSALAQVGLTFCFSLFAAVVVALRVAQSLTRPIADVKEAALQVAAGQYGLRIAVESPRELAAVAESFSSMSETLARTVREWDEVHRDLEQRRGLDDLSDRLSRLSGREPGARARRIDARDGALTLVWLLDETVLQDASESKLAIERSQAEIAAIITRVVERDGTAGSDLLKRLEEILGERVAALALLEAECLAGTR